MSFEDLYMIVIEADKHGYWAFLQYKWETQGRVALQISNLGHQLGWLTHEDYDRFPSIL